MTFNVVEDKRSVTMENTYKQEKQKLHATKIIQRLPGLENIRVQSRFRFQNLKPIPALKSGYLLLISITTLSLTSNLGIDLYGAVAVPSAYPAGVYL